MKNKWLQGILIGLALLFILVNPFVFGIIAIPTWIYLFIILRKKGPAIFNEQLEEEKAKRLLKQIKQLLTAAGILFLISWTFIILHQAPVGISENLATVCFFVGVITLYIHIFTTAAALYLFLKARRARKMVDQ